MRDKAVIFIGRIDTAMWEYWFPFCKKHDLDVYVVTYANNKEECEKYTQTIINNFGSYLCGYHIERTVLGKLEFNGWTIHPRAIQLWRMWDYYMKHPVLASYPCLLKARLDVIPPNNWELPQVKNNTIYIPKYTNHMFGLLWSDQIAYGNAKVMEKYCRMWERLPLEPPPDTNWYLMDQLFFHNFSPETFVQVLLDTEKFDIVPCFDSWEINREKTM